MQSSRIRLSVFLCLSMCLGIGILRFSYTALLPSTRDAFGWSQDFASILSSANLLGYLIGAFGAMRLPQTKIMSNIIQGAAIFGVISLISCSFSNFDELWYIFWRIISGVSGGLLMILSPSVIAQCAAPQDRFKINFIGFSGIGIGVLLATLFLPYLDRLSIQTAWRVLSTFAFIICIALSYLLQFFKHQLFEKVQIDDNSTKIGTPFYSLLIAYSSSAFAYIPHSLFWIDYLSHKLKINLILVNINWILYGTGSALGAYIAYLLARKLGNFITLKILYSFYVIAILLAIFSYNHIFAFLSSFLTGLLNPAVVFLTSYTILQLYGLSYKKLWSVATLSFALIQLVGGICFSFLQKIGLEYNQQFILASIVLLIGTIQLIWFTSVSNTRTLSR
ncbi:YbfB/YjiJ family MFS transporter [Acinetobacter nosocomialis]|uniref:YbfB/YjiJ family MFS transporter n=1 Tax=Acinetobacter calcoaceticus/baumannii complex TaxID=909768 RepID=UPI0018DB0EDE|nr:MULTISPECIES: YbfB/YjiJ family MFS transporter [Acinetobacter calcoaceticus/baumannii complex]MDO7209484.1 YbfB/YjiJ family MFS transporter [Acinetobacter nosocomialis]QPV60844.1 YbfB/YjiJ family MFS transporter [Acinetobacter seifertii]